MRNKLVCMVMLVLFLCACASATTYTIGNDGDDYTTHTLMNTGEDVEPGDIISFRRGETFREQVTVEDSGTSGNVITYTAHGTGADPIINGADLFATGSFAGPDGNGEYTIAATTHVYILIRDGIRLTEGTAGSLSANEWDWSGNVLYVKEDPTGYTTFEGSQRNSNIYIDGKSYITIENITCTTCSNKNNITNIDIRGGSDYVTVQDCTITYPYDKSGVCFRTGSDNGIVNNCIIYAESGNATALGIDFGISGNAASLCSNATMTNNTMYNLRRGGAFHYITTGTAQNNTVYSCDREAFVASQSTGLSINNNTAHDLCSGATSNGFNIGTSSGNIFNNTIYNVTQNTNDGYGIVVDIGSSSVSVYRNLLYNIDAAGIAFYQSNTSSAYYNVMYDTGDGTAVSYKQCGIRVNQAHDIDIYNNTIYSPNKYGIVLAGSAGNNTYNVNVKNNITSGSTTYALLISDEYVTTGLDFDNNDWYFTSGGMTSWDGTTYATLALYQAGQSQDTSSISSDPLFVDADNNGFHLQPGSPCIGAGVDVGLSVDYDGEAIGHPPDIGAYEYIPTEQTHALSLSSTSGGSVTTPGEGQFQYDDGTVLSIQATAVGNYHFVNWTGTAVDAGQVANPGAASTAVTLDADYTIQANFALDQRTLTISSTSGGSATNPGEGSFQYDHGTVVSIQATAAGNYHFVNWTGTAVDAGKVANQNAASTTVTADADYAIQANFAIDQRTLTISSTSGGSATNPGEGYFIYDHGAVVSIQAAAEGNHYFVNWAGTAADAGKVANQNAAGTTVTMDADYTIQANFADDETAPRVTNCSPAADSIQVLLNNLISLNITDAGTGVDADSVTIQVNNNIVYTGDTNHYTSIDGHCYRTGTKADYTFIYQSDEMFDYDQTVTITVNATDLAGNVMDEYSYYIVTEMRSFGQNKKVNSGLDNLNNEKPVTVCDSSGNIWAVSHAGPSSRDIYISKLAAGAENFGNTVQLTDDAADQCNPAVALDSNDKLYVVWQDDRRGDWDIYVSTSVDGIDWSTETRVNDPNNDNQVNPAVVIDSQSPNYAHVVWQDDRGGNQDIYIASSGNSFLTKTTSQVTSDSSDQVEPTIAVDSDNTIYAVWTDARGSSSDIYGAASNNGWTNVAIVSNTNNQSSPAIAAESAGSMLHLLWVDDTPGDNDIYYVSSDGLPGSPLTGSSIIIDDDGTGADQLDPTIAVTGSTGNNLKVFACWQDWRNVTGTNTNDTDLYFVELSSGSGTNVFVGDDGSSAYQGEPAIGIDEYGYPYLIWADNRSTTTDIYYAGTTFVEPVALASELVTASASSSTTVGTDPQAITTIDDVSVVVPAGACSYDVAITIAKIANPQAFAVPCLGGYDFGPSGIQFSQPVTITIPYAFSGSDSSATPYWFNSLTGALSQQGITDIQDIPISSFLHALSFKTTHFTAFFLLAGGGAAAIAGGGGGGGGCSVSAGGEGNIVEFVLPYIGLVVVMAILKMRDARYHKARSM